MKRKLYFICPTDHLESIINNKFPEENFFYTSLVNSVNFNLKNTLEISRLVNSKEISEINFVLSINNVFVEDALNKQLFNGTRGLKKFYNSVRDNTEFVKSIWYSNDVRIPIISNYLNSQIRQFSNQIYIENGNKIMLNGQIYIFNDTYFERIQCNLNFDEVHNLN